ncbi:hypothetical protein Tco_1456369 [Tanacetum coccineum]
MDSIISLGQKNTLAEYMILSGADNRPPMLDKDCLLADIYSLMIHHRVAKDLWEIVQLLMQGTSLTKQERECKLYDAFDKFTHIKGESLHTLPVLVFSLVFSPGDDPIACLNKAMAFLMIVASSRFPTTKLLFKMAGLPCNKFRRDKGKIILVLHIRAMLLFQGEILQVDRQ